MRKERNNERKSEKARRKKEKEERDQRRNEGRKGERKEEEIEVKKKKTGLVEGWKGSEGSLPQADMKKGRREENKI